MSTIKQTIVIAIFFALCSNVTAQKRVTIGPVAGIGSSNIINYPFSYGPNGSARVGAVSDLRLTMHLFLTPEISYGSFSNENEIQAKDEDGNITNIISRVNKLSTVDIPVSIKLKLRRSGFRPYYALGAGPSFLLKAKYYSKTDGNKDGADIDIKPFGYNNIFLSLYNTVGFEIEAGKIIPFLEAKYQYSLTPINSVNTNWAMRNFTVNLGFKF